MALSVADVAFVAETLLNNYALRSSYFRYPLPNYTLSYLPLNYFPLILV